MEFKTNFLIKYTVIATIFSIVLAIGMLNFNQALATNQTNTLPSHAILQLINKWGYVGTGHGNFSLYNPLDPDPIHHACSIIEQSTATPGTLPTCYPNPRGITIDYFGNVYVVDTIGRQIQKFDSNGHFIKSWGSYGNGNNQFSLPWDISSDSSGHLYIADNCCNHRIEVYNSDGTFIKKWGGFGPVNGNGTFDSPSSIAVDPIRHFVYVSDAYNRVQKFDSNGNFITKWGQNNLSQTGNIGSQGLAVDPNGNVYVTNWFQDSVSKFDNNGHLITKWGIRGTGDGQFGCNVNPISQYCYDIDPQGIAVDHKGHVYVVDIVNNRVEIFTTDGHFLTAWGSAGSGDYQFNNPTSIAVDNKDHVYISDSGNHRIVVFSVNFEP